VPSIHVDMPTADAADESLLIDSVVDEGVARLSGVGAFSPAPSEPPSPTLSRRELPAHGPKLHPLVPLTRLELEDASAGSSGSSGESRFASEEDGEDGEGLQLRRRARPWADEGEGAS
jgi:hypothetical protein